MSLVDVHDDGAVRTITLNDPEHRNVLSPELTAQFVAACDDADHDPSVRVVVVTNTGTTFCAGADLSTRRAGTGTTADAVDPARLFGRFSEAPKPYVGRVAGHCIAGGMGLLAGLDVTVAPRSARFGFTEVRIGAAPAMISVVCLPKLRLADAQAAFLRGHRFDADEAARIGLLTYAVDDDQLNAATDEIVADLLRGAPGALRATKRLLREVPSMDREDAFAMTKQLSSELFAGDEAREGMTAFLEKRRPSWSPEGDGA